MSKMENLNLLKKLHFIQGEVDKFMKDGKGYNYKYTKGSTVLDKLRPLWHEKQLLLKQEIISTKNTVVTHVTSKGKELTEVLSEVTLKFTWIDTETGEFLESLWSSNGMNDFEKGIGSAATYGERYFLLKFFHIHSDEDDPDKNDRKPEGNDSKGGSGKSAKRKAQEKFIQENEKQFINLISKCLQKLNKQSYTDLSDEDLEKLKTEIAKRKNNKEE